MSRKTKHHHEKEPAQDDPVQEPPRPRPEPEGLEEQPVTAMEDLQKLQEERDALFERLARATADFQNSRRRLESEMDQAIQYANTSLIKHILPVLDSFERALAVDPAKSDAADILKGMRIVYDQMQNVLKMHHVEPIAPKEGEPFDPMHHEALMQQEDERFKEPAVTQLLQKGYKLHERVLRPAQVAVSKTS